MPKARITFNDGSARTLQSDFPDIAARFGNWTPVSQPVGEAVHDQAVGERTMSRTSMRHGAAFEIRGLAMGAAAGASVDIADRLIAHLLAGGQCAVYTEDSDDSTYLTCGLWPGSTPALALTDPVMLEYTLQLRLINTATVPVPMVAYYGITGFADASGGTESEFIANGYKYKLFTFTSSATLTVTRAGWFDILLVAGGGSGAGAGGTGLSGGGGGGGGVRRIRRWLTVGTHTITVGDGGAVPAATAKGNSGADSSLDSDTATGGGGAGGGQFGNRDARDGGSGGGGGSLQDTQGLGGAGTTDQGNNGANGATGTGGSGENTRGGGGGGAGGAGATGTASGAGGAGVLDDITGTSVRYGAGGGGGASGTFAAGAAGTGGAGAGGKNANGTAGTDGKGEGGGGASSLSGSKTGGKGGKGAVYVRIEQAA